MYKIMYFVICLYTGTICICLNRKTVEVGATFEGSMTVKARRPGERYIIASMECWELEDVEGYTSVTVKGKDDDD